MITLREALSANSEEHHISFTTLHSAITRECPKIMSALRLVDRAYAAGGRPKGYNLVQREHKQLGFVYYVRYWHEGAMLPSKWCTHTNEYEKAREFAERNREALIAGYLGRHDRRFIRFFRRFFDAASGTYRSERRRNGDISEGRRKRYHSVMTNKFIPFLKRRRIEGLGAVTTALLDDFQETLLARGMKPQSVNDGLIAVRKAFAYLARKGLVPDNPCLSLKDIPERMRERETHGCYEIGKIKGVFDRRWKDTISYTLNLLIYTTGMRNGEITSFGKDDIITLGGCRFISLKRSKTENGVRLVPLHERVYQKVLDYARGMPGDAPVFGGLSGCRFSKAYKALGRMLNVSEEYLRERNITYYSGRHFWKTLMSAEGLGEDVEEVFMGHKVSGDVSKLYNHRDMRGSRLMVRKAKEVFRILDRRVFTRGTN